MDTAATVTLLVTIDRVSSSINIYDFVNEAPKTKPNNSPYNQRFWPTNDGLWNDGVVSCMWHMAHDLINNTQLLNEAEKEALMITSNFRPSTTFDTNSQFTILTTHDVINTRALKSVRTIKFRGINNPSPLSFWSAHHPQSSIWTFMQLPKTNVMTDCALFVARLLAAASLYHTLSGGLSLLASEKYVWNNDEQHVKCVTKYEIDSDTGSCPACLRALDMLYSRMDTFAKKRFDKTQQLARQNQQKAKGLAANATSKKRKNITPDLVPKDKDVSVTTQNSTHTVKRKKTPASGATTRRQQSQHKKGAIVSQYYFSSEDEEEEDSFDDEDTDEHYTSSSSSSSSTSLESSSENSNDNGDYDDMVTAFEDVAIDDNDDNDDDNNDDDNAEYNDDESDNDSNALI